MDKEITQPPTKISLPRAANTLLPHKPPMLLVEALVEREGACAVAMATLPAVGLFITATGHILPEYFIELIAQTAALGNCFDAVTAGNATRNGMLVGVDSFSWPGQPQPGTPVHIETDIAFSFGAMKVIHGEVYAGKALLAVGDIKVWEDLGKDTQS
ncbi:MAG: ACP dehydratase [Proteobacteria bacterium]|nr:ACP dehydratase [Pseudomonadota bacterium]